MATTTLHFHITLDEVSTEEFKILIALRDEYADTHCRPGSLFDLAYSGGTAFLEAGHGGDPLAAAEVLQEYLQRCAPERTVTFQVGIISAMEPNETTPGRFGGEVYAVSATHIDVTTTEELATRPPEDYERIETLYRDEAEEHDPTAEGKNPPIQVELRAHQHPEILIRDAGGLAIHVVSIDLFDGDIRMVHHDLRNPDGIPSTYLDVGTSRELERAHDEDDVSFIDRAA